MRVLIVEPGKAPYEKDIENSLDAMGAIVGGPLESLTLLKEQAAIMCNEIGKLIDLPRNRALFFHGKPDISDIIHGTFFICEAPSDGSEWCSLSDEHVLVFKERFRYPESFIELDSLILCIPSGEEGTAADESVGPPVRPLRESI